MAIQTFGVTAEGVRGHCFPHAPPWSADTAPSSTVVAEKIDTAAGMLAGKLVMAGVSPDSIIAATAAYASCAGVLRLMAAIECAQAMTGVNPEAVKAWQAKVDAWVKALEEGGASFLGDASLETSPASAFGPNSHIEYLGLSVPSSADASEIRFPFRTDDVL